MTIRKTVSRATILKAIRTEPLASAVGFVNFPYNRELKKCKVCAVGAVLRHAGMDNYEIHNFGQIMIEFGPCGLDAPLSAEEFVKDKDYLHALSVKFETQAEKTGTGKRTRTILANFVKKHFPKRIKLDPEF